MPPGLFFVERYVPGLDGSLLAALGASLSEAAGSLRTEGHDVEWLQTLGLERDDVCFCLFRAASEELVHEANRRARADFERISPVLAVPEM